MATAENDVLDRLYAHIARDLSYQVDGVLSFESVVRLVEEVRADLDRRSRIKEYLPVLVERQATEVLRSCVQRPCPPLAEHPIGRPPMLVFVCARSAGRTQLAEALVRRLVGTRLHVVTAGTIPTSALEPAVQDELVRIGIPADPCPPVRLTDELVESADAVVSLGGTDPVAVRPAPWYAHWDVLSPAGQDPGTVRAISEDLEGRITRLVREFGFDPLVAQHRRDRAQAALRAP